MVLSGGAGAVGVTVHVIGGRMADGVDVALDRVSSLVILTYARATADYITPPRLDRG